MKKIMLVKASLLMLLVLLMIPIQATADRYQLEEEGGRAAMAMTLDALVVRPLHLGITAAGTAFFTLTLPISAMTGSIDSAAEHLVREPARNTFQRCMGCVEVKRP